MEDLRYPIGKFAPPENPSEADRKRWIEDIRVLPGLIRRATEGLSDEQLDTPYREGGWSVRQVVHHLADGHLHAYTRLRLALTEETPRIKPFDENLWAELPDARTGPVEDSLSLLDGLHGRWAGLLETMSERDWNRAFDHPESGHYPLDRLHAYFAWHGRHHVAHIVNLRKRNGW